MTNSVMFTRDSTRYTHQCDNQQRSVTKVEDKQPKCNQHSGIHNCQLQQKSSSSLASFGTAAAAACVVSTSHISFNCCYADTFAFAFVGPFVTGLWRTLTFPPAMPFDFLWLIKIVSSSLDTSDSDFITLLVWLFLWPTQHMHHNHSTFNFFICKRRLLFSISV